MFKRYAAITAVFAGLITLFAPAAQGVAKPSDCTIVAKADRPLCEMVKGQLPYAYATESGIGYVVSGKKLVHEITHQGLTKGEMRSYLRGEAASYREYATGSRSVVVNLASLRKHYGTDAQYVVGFEDVDSKPGGRKDDRVEIDLP